MRLAKVKHKHDAELIAALLRKVDDHDPTIDMGETGEEYSFEVFRFAAKCLITGSTCSEIARLVDVFFDCFYPKRAGAIRLPGRRQWEEWEVGGNGRKQWCMPTLRPTPSNQLSGN